MAFPNAQPFKNKAYKDVVSFERNFKRMNVDTTGITMSGNFAPDFAPSNGNVYIWILGGGYIMVQCGFTNVCAQGYMNTNNSCELVKYYLIEENMKTPMMLTAQLV